MNVICCEVNILLMKKYILEFNYILYFIVYISILISILEKKY